LIPLTHFANPDGPKGEKTRTWFSLNRQPLIAWAGFCRNTPEFGAVFAGMTGEANEKVRPLNDRMPVLLKPDEYDRWLHADIQEVIRFQFREPPPSENFDVLETRDRWQSGVPPQQSIPKKSNRSTL
jgi:putative SOS response-associated peptidase YedK